jgi:outer membrane protein assembly factor BamB
MSMRIVTSTILAGIIAAVCLILALIITSRTKPTGTEGRGQKTEDRNRSSVLRPLSSGNRHLSWPMFRGGQELSGKASGTLADSMTLLWKFKTGGPIKSSPVVDDGLVFVGSADANIYAIDLEKGSRVWAYKTTDAVEATPCVAAGSVFVGSADGFLYALDARTGSLRWKYQTGGQILGAANWTPALASAPVAEAPPATGAGANRQSPRERGSPDGQGVWILVGSYDNKLHCVDSATGKVVWTYETESFVNGAPAIGKFEIPAKGGVAVFGGCDARIHVVSLVDGNAAAQIDAGAYIAGSAAFVDGQAYVGNYDNVLIKADVAAGAILWKYSGADAPFFSSPAVGEDVVVVGGRDNRVHCIRRSDGKQVWTFATLGAVDSSPVICGGKVVVGCEDGRVYMLRLSDGSKVWSYEIGQAVTSSPAVVGGMIVIGSDDGFLYAFVGSNA